MTRTLSFFDRLTTFLAGLLLLAIGLLPIALYWDIPYVSEYLTSFDRARLASVPQENWYAIALIVSFIVLLLLGSWLVLANIQSRGFSTAHINALNPSRGETSINIQRVAQAACDYMSDSEMIRRAEQSVAMVRNRPTVTFTVTADPAYTLDDAAAFLEAANEDFSSACRTVDIDIVYKLHFDRINA